MSVNSKMTALADEIRELSGTTTTKSIDTMTTDVNAANEEIAEQTELLEQIVTALEGKAGGSQEDVTAETNTYTTKLATLETAITELETELQGKASGGSAGGSVETCTVTINYNQADFGGIGGTPISKIYGSMLDNNGNIQSITLQSGIDFEFDDGYFGNSASITVNNIVKNSILTIIDGSYDLNEYIQHNFELISEAEDDSPRIFLINQDGNIIIG